jgi:hypothetical protein
VATTAEDWSPGKLHIDSIDPAIHYEVAQHSSHDQQVERPPKAVRYKSDLVNDKGYFDPIEVGRTFGEDRLGSDAPVTFY